MCFRRSNQRPCSALTVLPSQGWRPRTQHSPAASPSPFHFAELPKARKPRGRKPKTKADDAAGEAEAGEAEGKAKGRPRRPRKKGEGEAGDDTISGETPPDDKPKFMPGAERRTSAGDDEPEIRSFFEGIPTDDFDPDAWDHVLRFLSRINVDVTEGGKPP